MTKTLQQRFSQTWSAPLAVLAVLPSTMVGCGDDGQPSASDTSYRQPRRTHPPKPVRPPPQTLYDKQIEIPEDQYYSFAFELNRKASVTVHVDGVFGPAFEVWTMPRAGFHKFEEAGNSLLGGEFSYVPDLSEADIHEMKKTAVLDEGRYYLVIDNTDQGEVSPPSNFSDDKVTANVKVIVR